eukprot:jgi/Mesen1/1229/ME000129S00323
MPLGEAVQPWAWCCNKRVLTGVLRELGDDAGFALGLFRWAEAQPWYANGKPDPSAYCARLAVCARAREPSLVYALMEEMEHKRCRPCAGTFSEALRAYGEAGMWREAEDVTRRMEDLGMAWTRQTCKTLMDVYSSAGLYNNATEAYETYVAGGNPTWSCAIAPSGSTPGAGPPRRPRRRCSR